MGRSGYPPETALTLGRFVAGSSARAKARRRLGIIEETQEAEERRARAAELKPRRHTVHLLGRDIPVLAAGDVTLRAGDDGKPVAVPRERGTASDAVGARAGATCARSGHGGGCTDLSQPRVSSPRRSAFR